MSEKPLSVVIAALIHDNKLLLIKRKRGDYQGLYGLPGGKIEMKEHLSDAAVREIKEETGIMSDFVEHLGFVSEHLVDRGEINNHFLLHLCILKPQTTMVLEGEEGISHWFELNFIQKQKESIIPSDYLMIEKMIKQREGNYFNCVIEKVGDEHILRKFRS